MASVAATGIWPSIKWWPPRATATGNAIEEGGTPVYKVVGRRARERAGRRPNLSREELRARLRPLLGLPEDAGGLHHRSLRAARADDAVCAPR